MKFLGIYLDFLKVEKMRKLKKAVNDEKITVRAVGLSLI